MCPLKTNRDRRILKRQYEVWNIPIPRLPALFGKALWEKVRKGRDGIRWDSVDKHELNNRGWNQEDIMAAETLGRHKSKSEETLEAKEELAPRNKVKWTDTYYGGP